jgi:hypothetical protein
MCIIAKYTLTDGCSPGQMNRRQICGYLLHMLEKSSCGRIMLIGALNRPRIRCTMGHLNGCRAGSLGFGSHVLKFFQTFWLFVPLLPNLPSCLQESTSRHLDSCCSRSSRNNAINRCSSCGEMCPHSTIDTKWWIAPIAQHPKDTP